MHQLNRLFKNDLSPKWLFVGACFILPLFFLFPVRPNDVRGSGLSPHSPCFVSVADTPRPPAIIKYSKKHLRPGPLRKTGLSGAWRVALYSGSLMASRAAPARLDTLFISSVDTIIYSVGTETRIDWSIQNYRTLSILGDVVSYRLDEHFAGGAHPVKASRYHTIQLGTLRRDIPITELFPAADIYRALMADTLVLRHMASKKPADLSDLVRMLDGGCEVDFAPILSSWCIRDITRGSAIVEFGLGHGYQAGMGRFTNIRTRLSIPPRQIEMFKAAKKAGMVSAKM